MSDGQSRVDSDDEGPETNRTPEEHAESIITSLADGDYERVVSRFSDEFASEFSDGISTMYEFYLQPDPEPFLDEHWRGLTALYGSFEQISAIESSVDEEEDETTVSVTLEFDQRKYPIQMSVTAEGQITDLTFATSYEPPEYVDESQLEEREVTIETDDLDLDGTLTVPKDTTDAPGVVLVHGTGGTDRDYTTGANKILKDIAYGLANHGIAGLRYDKRTYVTDIPPEEFDLESVVIDDAIAAVDLLETVDAIDPERRVVVGHSLGGTCATFIADRHDEVAGIINIDGPVLGSSADLFIGSVRERWEREEELSEYGEEQIRRVEEIADRIESGDIEPDETIMGRSGAWMESYNSYAEEWLATTNSLSISRYIVMNGRERPHQAAEWTETLRTELDDSNAETALYESLNHYLQRGDTPSSFLEPLKFRKPPAETVIDDMAEWISTSTDAS